MIDGQNFFYQPIKNNFRTYDNLQKIATSNTICRSKAIHQINFTASLERDGNTAILFINEEAKKTILDFSP